MKNPPMQSDLFGQRLRPCAHCGSPFAFAIEGRGRPEVTCSELCRVWRAKAQRRAWARKQRKAAAVVAQ